MWPTQPQPHCHNCGCKWQHQNPQLILWIPRAMPVWAAFSALATKSSSLRSTAMGCALVTAQDWRWLTSTDHAHMCLYDTVWIMPYRLSSDTMCAKRHCRGTRRDPGFIQINIARCRFSCMYLIPVFLGSCCNLQSRYLHAQVIHAKEKISR